MACFFCHQPLGRRWNKHHTYPRRYGRPRQAYRLVKCHIDCHRRFHTVYDNQHWSRSDYLERMAAIAFGDGIFAPVFDGGFSFTTSDGQTRRLRLPTIRHRSE